MIIEEKVSEKKKLSEGIVDATALAEVTQVLSLVDLAEKYMWAIGNADRDANKKLRQTCIKKY